jgi:prolyl oligopeptidase
MPKFFSYPPARKDDAGDNFHGSWVANPYQWLEVPDSADTQAFIAAQNTLTQDYLSEIPAREVIKSRLMSLWNFPRYTPPSKEGSTYFYSKNDGLQNQAVIYRQTSLDAEPIVVLDPNTLSEDGTVAVVNTVVSDDAKLMAYVVSVSGSDLQDIYIREVETGKVYDEVLKWGRFSSIAWLPDSSGFFYNRYPEKGTVAPEDMQAYNRLYLHKVGTPQSEDVLVYERPDAKALNFPPEITNDKQYIVLNVWYSTLNRNRVFYRELNGTGDFIRLIDVNDALYYFMGNEGSTFYFQTDLNAPHGRVIAVDLDHPERENWREIIPQGEDSIQYAGVIGGRLLILKMHHAANEIDLYHMDGTFEREIPLPTVGSLFSLYAKPDSTEMFFDFTSFLYPPTVFRYVFATGELSVFRAPTLDFDVSAYETQRVFYESKDGTRVPMFLTHKKGLVLNGDTPTMLYGYGGYGVSTTPSFSVGTLEWIENGGVYAVACMRGGGEYGEDWHQAGMLEKKQNVFDDFIAAAEWLIANRYTNTKKLAIYGGSNGGLLVAACMVQRPDLFGAVLCSVPVIDMLRYHRFTAGRYWVHEYGNAEENAEHFKFLMQYSPLENIKPDVQYPPLLILTAESDDRVVPMHSLKFAATLQAADEGEGANPLLLRVETKAGHGFGKPVSKIIEQQADMYAFLFRIFQMG